MRRLLLVAATVLMVQSAAAVYATGYDGEVSVELARDQYQPGDTVNPTLELTNRAPHPVVNGYAVVHLVYGCADPTYPSQLSNCDNIVHEEIVGGINLSAKSTTTRTISLDIPTSARSGTYRIDAYFKTPRTPIDGIPFIFSNPSYESFTVTGQSGTRPRIKIVRTETAFKGTEREIGSWRPDTQAFQSTEWPWIAGPVGVYVTDRMNKVPGRIVIQNTGETTQVTVTAMVCNWDDTHCPNPVDTSATTVTATGDANTTAELSVDAPQEPGAYAVRIAVTKNGELLSLYRNRIIRAGRTARIRKLTVDKPYVPEGGRLGVGLLVGTSPDHYQNPSVTGVTATVMVTNMENGNTVLEEEKSINRLSNVNPLWNASFSTTAGQELSRFRVKAVLSANGERYDQYSYVVDASDFAGPVADLSVERAVVIDGNLTVELCGRDASGIPANSEVQALLFKGSDLLKSGTATLDGCGTVTYQDTSPGEYTLQVNANKQFTTNITATPATGRIVDGGSNPLLLAVGAVVIVAVAGLIIRQLS